MPISSGMNTTPTQFPVGARILYVDDDTFMLNAFRRMVRLSGYEVVTFASPLEALNELRGGSFDVICSDYDYRLPDMTGLDFLTEAHRIAPEVPRILITAHHDFEVAVDAFHVGISRLLPKPWKRETVLGALADAVRTVRLFRENIRLTALLEQHADALAQLNRSLDQKVSERTDQVISALITCLDYRDEETMAHSKRVSLMTRAIAERMGLPEQELLDIEWGALLHDVGKIGVPDRILLKPGKLTPEEWLIMRRHATIGHHMLSRLDFLQNAAKVVGDHHERFDGSGYPRGKSDMDIYIGARIFAVADTFDAITSDRPYRSAQSDESAIAEIERVCGTQLDPICVAAFMTITEETWTTIRDEARTWAADHAAPAEALPMGRAGLLSAV